MSREASRFEIAFEPRARRELKKMDRSIVRRVYSAIMALSGDPRPVGCRPLKGYPGLWRIRVGSYRVVYAIDDDRLVVLALRVAHRREVYRSL